MKSFINPRLLRFGSCLWRIYTLETRIYAKNCEHRLLPDEANDTGESFNHLSLHNSSWKQIAQLQITFKAVIESSSIHEREWLTGLSDKTTPVTLQPRVREKFPTPPGIEP
ncbi:hypothetical protein POM88_008329 [Heracleum sosnowskyi]|uniref:Uncharacterized protein n=1 Tax=Heracleum sosnowskyi TaxID=360622 RepID=A0AAD8J765_9APIA|nr:hypothetical protein POM88_008329 [Heracleum sosnowskyi]